LLVTVTSIPSSSYILTGWRSDGTAAGTTQVLEHLSAKPITILGTDSDALYYALDDGVHGLEPWYYREETVSVTDPGRFQLATASLRVDEGVGRFRITINRTGGSDGTATVRYATADGSAIAGEDYQAASGVLSFAPGETSKAIDIAVLDDA